jgi:hypothetical protein
MLGHGGDAAGGYGAGDDQMLGVIRLAGEGDDPDVLGQVIFE